MQWIQRCSYCLVILLVACRIGGGGGGSDEAVGKTLKPINDTGITLCGDYGPSIGQNSLDCTLAGSGTDVDGIDTDGDIVPAGQDAHYGRDAKLSTNNNSDGHAGFSFTKLDSDGNTLAASALAWVCVRDNITGLIWETKTDNDGVRDKDWEYTWYNSDGSNNGGSAGSPDTGDGAGSDDCFNKARCDTQKYVADINEQNLCGHADWRLPTIEELQSIVSLDRTFPAIDSDYFPDMLANNNYWSASPVADNSLQAWFLDSYDGSEYTKNKEQPAAIRLVRVGKPFKVIYVVE